MSGATATLKHAFQEILEAGTGVGSFHILLGALKATGIAEMLRRGEPFTLFAPTDEAFAKLEEGTSQDWLRRQTRPRLRAILKYHVLAGRMPASEIIKSSSVRTIQGNGLTIRFTRNRMYVNNAQVLLADVACDNGVIHVLDTVVVPR